ncbi:hypothetical protein R3P38DRAFT_2933871 [Favolaschia claudopus]|uniref:Ubiquitin-like protease family profile domain-containing protein n=1 Tax=Favolaschia claudopus TaxID=2862362 RepID=A0AAW0BS30_9AGAR
MLTAQIVASNSFGSSECRWLPRTVRLGTIANPSENHWVALTVDGEKGMVGYGDGFGKKVPDILRQHVDWWLFEHLGVTFKWKNLPTTKQTDAHSCGLIAYFALLWNGSINGR